MTQKRFWVLVVSFHCLFFIWQWYSNHIYLTDSKEYLWAAENLHSGTLNCANPNSKEFLNPDFLTKRPPIYPALILIFHSILSTDVWIIFIQNLLSIGILYVLVLWIQSSQKTVHWGILSLLLVFSPAQIIYANMIMSEIWLQGLILLGAYWNWKFLQTAKYSYFIGMQLMFALAFLTKPVMYLFVFPLLLYSIYILWKNKQWKAVLWVFFPILVCFSYMKWNQSRTGYFHFSSIQKINLLTYNTWHFMLGQMPEKQVDSIITHIQDSCQAQINYAAQCQCETQASLGILFSPAHQVQYVFTHIQGMFQLFLDPGRFDLYHFLGISSSQNNGLLYYFHQDGLSGIVKYIQTQPWILAIYFIALFIANIFKLLIISLFPFLKRNIYMLFPYILLLYVAALTGPIGASRFLVPFLPIYFWLIHAFFIGIVEKTPLVWHENKLRR